MKKSKQQRDIAAKTRLVNKNIKRELLSPVFGGVTYSEATGNYLIWVFGGGKKVNVGRTTNRRRAIDIYNQIAQRKFDNITKRWSQ